MKKKITELATSAENLDKLFKADSDKDLEYIEEVSRRMLLGLQNTKITQAKTKRQFRTSSLPFCPILEFIKDPSIEEYAKSHYTTTGTAIHETIQAWASVSPASRDIIYGSWKCTGCGAIKLNQFRPKKLCSCTYTISTTEFHRGWPKHWTYVEIEYDYNGLTGHIDMIVVPKPDWFFVKDYKTTELEKKKTRYGWTQDKVSSLNYIAQIRTYCTILDLEMDLPIKGWALTNVERGKPIKKLTDFHQQVANWSTKHSLKWQKWLDLSVENNEKLVKLENAVEKGNKERADKYLDVIIRSRPCTDEKTYNAYMVYKFYNCDCVLKNVCLKGSTKAIRAKVIAELAKKE